MKKCFLTIFLIAIVQVLFAAAPGENVYVAIKQSELKEGKGAFDKVITRLPYGTELYIKEATGKWFKVETTEGKKLTGWVPVSSVTSRKIVASKSGKKVSASADEIALAGKGFNSQVEEEYKTNKKLDYSKVDEMEKFVLPDAEIKKFVVEGKLKGVSE